jgi:hypothetical protein
MMAAGGQAFVIPARSNRGVYLWCLRVNEARGLKRRRPQSHPAVRRQCHRGADRPSQGPAGGRAREALARGFVPMFVLVRQVVPRKRLDVDGVRDQAVPLLLANVLAELDPE